jgi:very-short-patch-repair endonuclease
MAEVCEKAREVIRIGNRSRNEAIGALLMLCESPVEQILLATLYNYWHADVHSELNRLQFLFPGNYPAWSGLFTVCVEPQRTIRTQLGEGRYRVDFYFYLTRFRHHSASPGNSWPEMARLVVEVDGHDFHDRSKAQASYERKRQRDLTLEGYRVVRFTGSDVFNAPDACAEDIDFHLDDLASEVLDTYDQSGRLRELVYG